MKIAVPIKEFSGMDSQVYGHFGSAPEFVLVDSENREIKRLNNGDRQHVHGACHPMKALAGNPMEAVLVGGIGLGALMGLTQAGIAVYQVQGTQTINQALQALSEGRLSQLKPGDSGICEHHHDGGGCHH